MLTRRQHELLTYLTDRLEATGVAPTFDEIAAALGLKSKSGVHRMLTNLEERGYVRRLPFRQRALEVVRRAPDAAPDDPGGRSDAAPGGVSVRVVGGLRTGAVPAEIAGYRRTEIVPRIALGAGEHFALDVEDASMATDGILERDLVLIRSPAGSAGERIALVVIDEQEVALARPERRARGAVFRVVGRADWTVADDRVRVAGHMTGLVRRY